MTHAGALVPARTVRYVAAGVTKATKIALGIAVAGACCGGLAIASTGGARVAWAWTAGSCVVAAAAYFTNRPAWLGKRGGGFGPWALAMLPYLVAYRIASALTRWWRGADAPTLIVPGLWVGGRLDARTFPAGVTHVVDLVAEYPAPRWARTMPGYRALLILDGGKPPAPGRYVELVRELRDVADGVLVHCDSGRGRAPTMAAAILIARGVAPDVWSAIAMIRARRPVASPTRTDVAFLERITPRLHPDSGAHDTATIAYGSRGA
jgi:Swiss Army Knife protein, DSP-PTPase phosphatase domain